MRGSGSFDASHSLIVKRVLHTHSRGSPTIEEGINLTSGFGEPPYCTVNHANKTVCSLELVLSYQALWYNYCAAASVL